MKLGGKFTNHRNELVIVRMLQTPIKKVMEAIENQMRKKMTVIRKPDLGLGLHL
jgi:hypothetical protein